MSLCSSSPTPEDPKISTNYILQPTTSSTLPTDTTMDSNNTNFSKMLHLTYPKVLLFYVGQTKRAMERRQQGPSKVPEDALEHFFQTKKQTDLIATEMCLVCPGTDLLEKEDLEVMFKHCSFVCLWLDTALMSVGSYEQDVKQELKSGDEFLRFNRHFQKSVTASLVRLKPDLFEYSALKGFCVWKIGVFDNSPTMRMVANEHYLTITHALVHYHKTTKIWQEYEMANRIAEITLLLGPMFSAYQDVQKLYRSLRIRDVLE